MPLPGHLNQAEPFARTRTGFVTGFELGCWAAGLLGCELPGGDNFTVEAMAGAWSSGASRGLLHIGRMAKQRLTLNLPNDFVPDSH